MITAQVQVGPDQFRLRLENRFATEAAIFAESVPYAGHLTDAGLGPIDEAYYLRHRIETVHRIRGTARTDALALSRMVEEDYESARAWAEYVVEELGHDRLFLRDLAAHGIRADVVLSTPRFESTERLLEELTTLIMTTGSIAAVAYSLFVEWNSEQVSAIVTDRAERQFGLERETGARQHLAIDEEKDHFAEMVAIAHRLSDLTCGEATLHELVGRIANLLRDYFRELHAATISPGGWQTSRADPA